MSSQEPDFDKLKRLLACKRFEQPPPNFFNHLADRVSARLEAEEFAEYSSWWQWLVKKFDAKPVVACAYGMVVSGLLLAGFRLSQIFESEVEASPVFNGRWLAATPFSSPLLPGDLGQNNWVATSTTISSPSTAPIFYTEPAGLLFNNSRVPVQPISFSVPSH